MQQIILANVHPVIIAGVRAYIDRVPDLSVAAIATSTDQLVARLEDTKCDILITDFAMPVHRMCDGFSLLSYVKRHHPDVCLIVFTMNRMPAVLYQVIKSGVDGLLHMHDEIAEIGRAIEDASNNSRYISKSVREILRAGPLGKMPTARETEVLRMYADGHSLHEIAMRLNKSAKTVGLQKSSAMKKMGLRNDVELGRYSHAGIAPTSLNLIGGTA